MTSGTNYDISYVFYSVQMWPLSAPDNSANSSHNGALIALALRMNDTHGKKTSVYTAFTHSFFLKAT